MTACRPQTRIVAVLLAASSWLAPTVGNAAGAEENRWLDRAQAIILRHHLLKPADLRCATLVYGVESTPKLAGISVLERHGHGCPGDPDTSPRMFTLDIDKTTGRATWDRDGDMRPIP